MAIPAEATVYVVDDDELARESVRALCASMGVPAKTYPSAEAFLADYDPSSRDSPGSAGCLVTDLRMVGMSGLDLQARIRDMGIELPVIVVTAYATTPVTVRAMQDGAITLLDKGGDDQVLWDAICRALAHDEARRVERRAEREFEERLASLTAEERAVLDAIVRGEPNKAIAADEGVSERTIETRRQRVFRKLGAESVAELVRFVVERRISPEEDG